MNLLVRVRIAVLERTIASGQVPTAGEIAAELDLPLAMVQEAYAKLGEGHVFVCEPGDPSRLRMANPFSAVPTPFKVSSRGGSYYGNWVWDSLGIVSLLGGDGRVETACPDCGEPLRLRVEAGDLVESQGVVHFSVPARHWWDDIVFTWSTMLLFRSEEHVERSGKAKGAFMTPEQLWRLADTWYHDRDDPEWRRRSADEAEQVFADLGLGGEFWRLT